jgi:hypothetical protein
MKSNSLFRTASHEAPKPPEWVNIVRDRVNGLRFGTVQIVVHEGQVIQVDSTQRTRLSSGQGTLK